jgi:protein-S-isoprenylcysteine O-methyltransferase Ste14
MPFVITAIVMRVLWLAIEYPYVRRFQTVPVRDWDKHSAKLWDFANLIELVGLVLGFMGIGRIQTTSPFIAPLGLALLFAGTFIRWSAIWTLGQYFTGAVLIKEDHQLIRNGLYKYLRHPAYSGALLAHLGLGLSFNSWFSLLFSSLPFFAAAFYRMHVEEKALQEAFGTEYREYAKSTKRLIPSVY